jgi:Zinc finger, C3HC4 type (RING finger)
VHGHKDSRLHLPSSPAGSACRLRQICDAPELCPHDAPVAAPAAYATAAADKPLSANERQELILKLVGLVASGALEDCPICMDDVSSPVITTCGHVFCRGCIEHWLANEAACPLCRAKIAKAALVDAPPEAADEPLVDSSAVRALKLSHTSIALCSSCRMLLVPSCGHKIKFHVSACMSNGGSSLLG